MKIKDYLLQEKLIDTKYKLSEQHIQKIREGNKKNWEKRRKEKIEKIKQKDLNCEFNIHKSGEF